MKSHKVNNKDILRETEISSITQGLKAIAKELNTPVIALSQLSRQIENRTNNRPKLSDLRGSGAIEQDADIVILLNKEDPGSNIINAYVAKHRNGPTGKTKLVFNKEITAFENFTNNSLPF